MADNVKTIDVVIDKPLNDDRQYEIIVLENELEVILVSDKDTQKSTAAMVRLLSSN